MKIAYIFVATGKYSRFIDGLVQSGTKNFFNKDNVDFIVFTDNESYINKYNNLTVIVQDKLGWPYDTLMRFHMINQIKEILVHDYIYFGNANMIFNEPVSDDVLPDEFDMVAALHPTQNNFAKYQRSYERNPNSLAFVPYGSEGDNYYQGCFFGGKNKAFLKMSEELANRIEIDHDNGIIAIWHDESHMNRYFTDAQPKALHSGYVYPENMALSVPKKIIQLDKASLGGHEYLRN